VQVVRDVLASFDAPQTPDAPVVVSDRPITPSDMPAVLGDVPASFNDAVTPSDTQRPLPDAPPCTCPAGVCIDGYCATTRCTYAPELGFICMAPGTVCRLIGAEAWCVPACVGVSCAANEFCDESSGGVCMRDNCAQIQCPIGTTCQRNQCGRFGDGGVFVPVEDGGTAADGGRPSTSVDDGGCGCRAPGYAGSSMRGLALLGLAVIARRRCGSRKPIKSSMN
jgi:hypothetical protein